MKKYYYIVGAIVLIIVLYYINSIVKKIKAQPQYIVPFNPTQGLSSTGTSNPQGLQVSVSDNYITDLASRLWKKIDGLTFWGWDEDILVEVLSLSEYDLARLNAAYKKLSSNDLDTDLENEHTGLVTPTGFNARKVIDRLKKIKYKV